MADDKADRIVIPPLKLTDVPLSDPAKDRDYRAYKIQFQAPQGVGMYTWKIHLVSDTYIGEEYTQNITVSDWARSFTCLLLTVLVYSCKLMTFQR